MAWDVYVLFLWIEKEKKATNDACMIIRTDGFRDKTECIETNTKEKQADNCSKSDSLSSELHVMSVHNKLSANSIRTVSVDVKHHWNI